MNIDVLYVVYEINSRMEDVSIVGVYSNKVKAEKKKNENPHYYIDTSYSNIIED